MTKRLMNGMCAVLLSAALAAPAAAQIDTRQDNTAYGGASGEFLLLGAGARGAALGGAFAALVTDVTALYYNPSGLAQLARPGVVVSSYSYVADTRYSWAGIGFPMGGGARAVGFSLGSFGFSDQPIYTVDNPDGDGRSYSVSETYVGLSYAQNFSDRFAAGITGKFVNDRLGSAKANAIAVDFGTSFHATVGARPIRASFVIQNLGSSLRHDGQDLDVGVIREPPLGTVEVPQEEQPARLRTTAWTLPVLFRVGVALDVVSQGTNRVTVLSEFTQANNTKPGAGAGFEWSALNLGGSGFSLAARGSYSIQADNQAGDLNFGGLTTAESDGSFTSDGVAFGGGIAYERRAGMHVGVDYAWRSLGTLGGTNFFTFSLGW
jgi:hypothetical protein